MSQASKKEKKRKPRTRPNGAGTAIKSGKGWKARVVVGWKIADDGHAIPIYKSKSGFSTRKDALEYCATLKATKNQAKRMTMQEIYDAWLSVHETRVGKSTMNCYNAAWAHFQQIHHVPMQEIDTEMLQECMDSCGKGRRTKENMKALAGLLMKYAIPRHQTDLNYAEYLHTGSDEKNTRPAFSPEQVEMIRKQIGKVPHAEDVYVLIYTGFRPAELFALTKDSYKDGVLYGGIKTEAGKDRAVPVSPKIQSIISEKLKVKGEWLFPRDDGTQMPPKYFRDNYFYPVLAAAGIQEIPTPEKPAYYVPYSCRHTFSNLLKNAPGSDKDKAGLMGHSEYRTTIKMYQSVEILQLKRIIDSL